jgi:hypothetical protein
MKCSCEDVERVLPGLVDGAPDGVLEGTAETGMAASDVEAHVKSCPACADLVSELKLIASEARQLAASEEPAPRVWVRIAAELRAEGLIRDQQTAPARPILVPSSSQRQWRAWWLAPVAAALVAAASYVVTHKPVPQPVAQQQAPAPPAATAATPAKPPVPENSASETTAVNSAALPAPATRESANKAPEPLGMAAHAVASAPRLEAPSSEDQQFLSVVSTLEPATRATYENELQAVNADIRETQAYVKRYPGDADARQHLMDAYQQKALLYQIALDRIQ